MSSRPLAPSLAPAQLPGGPGWTCPFCALLCDGEELATDASRYVLRSRDCARAAKALQGFAPATPSAAVPMIGKRAVDLATAIEAAAQCLAASKQPLFGGLATDVAGARALYPLACATGAICDPAGGAYQLHGLRALQDRGAFTTTFAEVRNRAELILCVTGSPRDNFPELWSRLGIGEDLVEQRELVFLDANITAPSTRPHTTDTGIALEGDLFGTVALLNALVARRRVPARADLAALAERLLASRYSVIVWEPSKLPEHGSLIVEALNTLIAALNMSTRAAALALSGNDGLAAVNYTFTWLSGLPLRSRAGPLGLEHEPLRFDAARLLQDGSVDALLWISCFGPEPAVPRAPKTSTVPTLVLGHPGMAVQGLPEDAVFIPVATPGLGAAGHLFRADGGVALPLMAVYEDGLPQLPEVLKQITQRVNDLKGASP